MDIDELLKLLKESATLETAKEFLKAHGAPHSARNWDQLINERFRGALADGTVTPDAVLSLAQECEEHGRQHIFLYRLKDGRAAPPRSGRALSVALEEAGVIDVFNEPVLFSAPSTMSLCSIRSERQGGGAMALILKAAEERVYLEAIDEDLDGPVLTRRFHRHTERAVNLAKFRSDGKLEVRIFRQKSSGSNYAPLLRDFWRLINDVIPEDDFGEISLRPAKEYIWNSAHDLEGRVRVEKHLAKNAHGVTNQVFIESSESSLSEDEGAVESMDAFLGHGAVHKASHITWVQGQAPEERAINVALSGMSHEYAIGRACRRSEYDYVLDDILSFNG